MPFRNLPRKNMQQESLSFHPTNPRFFWQKNQGTEMGATSSREVKLKGSGHNSISIRKRQECTIPELFPCAWNTKKNGCLVGREWDVRCELCWSVGCLLCWKEFLEKEVLQVDVLHYILVIGSMFKVEDFILFISGINWALTKENPYALHSPSSAALINGNTSKTLCSTDVSGCWSHLWRVTSS